MHIVSRSPLLFKEKEEKIKSETDIKRTEILYGSENIVKKPINDFHKIKEKFDNCTDSTGPSVFINASLWAEFISLKNKGIKLRFITEITKDNVNYCKDLLKITELRHLDGIKENFGIGDGRYYLGSTSIKEGQQRSVELIQSNNKSFVDQQQFFFETLWDKAVPAEQKIKEIEEKIDYVIEIIRRSDIAFDIYLDIIHSASKEIFFIFPTPKAFIRQLKALYVAKQVSKERKVKIRILTPTSKAVEESIKNLLKEEKEMSLDLKYKTDYFFSYPDIKIRYIEKMSNTKATMLIIDGKESLVMELKDDTKDTFIESIGLSTHSTSKASVLSYVAIFENLWKQSELYQEIKESNEKLKINDKMQKEFINTAAHELRTPLQPIIILSGLLKNKIKDKEQEKLLDIIIKNARKLKNLTEDILDVTKIEGNTLNLNKEEFRIRDLLQPIIKEFEHCLEKSRAIKFELHLKNIDPNFIVVADQNRITQVISNLINNSIKFISKEDGNENVDGLISISVEKIKINDTDNNNINTDEVIINIKDNGEGIDSEIYPRLFTKFASKSFHGTGLGLFIAKNIIESHGGKIWAKNNEDGKGATFSFSLPLIKKHLKNLCL